MRQNRKTLLILGGIALLGVLIFKPWESQEDKFVKACMREDVMKKQPQERARFICLRRLNR